MRPIRAQILRLTAGRIAGWAFREGSTEPLRLILSVNDQERATADANRSLPEDAKVEGPAPQDCAFEFRFAAPNRLKRGDRVAIIDAATNEALPGTPFDFPRAAEPAEPEAAAAPVAPSPEEVEQMRAIIGRFPSVGRRSSTTIVRATLWAFALRELRDRFGRSRWGYLWAILQPILFMVGFMAIRTALGRGRNDIYDVSGMYFFWLGLAPFFMFLNGLNRAMGSTRAYRALFQFRQVQPLDVMLVRLLIEFATLGVVFVIVVSGFAWYGLAISADDVIGFVFVIGLLFAFTLGCALTAEVAIANYPESRQVINIIERPLFLISGTFFTIDHVPPAAREWLLWNPLLHGVDLARGTMLAKYDPIGSWVYLGGATLLALSIGLTLYGRYRMRLIGQ